MSITSLELYPQPYDKKATLLSAFKGKHVTELPTPSFVIKKSVIENNCFKMIQRSIDLDVKFRAHVKTVKTYPGLRNQMGYDLGRKVPLQDRVLVSTLTEAWQIVAEQKAHGETVVHDLLYGLPGITEQYLDQLLQISESVDNVRLMVDNVEHLQNIRAFNLAKGIQHKWTVFVKIDAGTNRAGIEIAKDSSQLKKFLQVLFSDDIKDHVSLFGFYCHMGHSYASDSIGKLEKLLYEEISFVSKAVDILKEVDASYLATNKVAVSVGATPTIHSFDNYLYKKQEPELDAKLSALIESIKSQNIDLEIHAGNYPICDLQQLATGCIEEQDIACYVLSQVISQYPGRRNSVGEMLMSTGVISMSKEVSTFKGYGAIRTFGEQYGDWYVDRLSQEHGILSPVSIESSTKMIPIGTKVKVLPQHSCITINSFSHIFLVDDNEQVVDVWIPWRGY